MTERVSIAPDASAPASTFPRLMVDFSAWMRIRNFSPCTITQREQAVGMFAAWLADRSITQPIQVTRPIIEAYQRALTQHRKANGQLMAVAGQYQRLRGIAVFFSFLHRRGFIPANPAADIEYPRLFRSLPFHLTHDETARVLAVPDVDGPERVHRSLPDRLVALRDRTFLEVLYGTGLRRIEAIRLRIDDLDPARLLVRVTRGKGGKDRVVPITARAVVWIERYQAEARMLWVRDVGEPRLFLNSDGTPWAADAAAQRVRALLNAAGITKPGACHLFRHTFATHLMENGCELRLIQGMLGHAGPEMTSRYAQVSARHLLAALALYHPAAKDGGAPPDAASAPDAVG